MSSRRPTIADQRIDQLWAKKRRAREKAEAAGARPGAPPLGVNETPAGRYFEQPHETPHFVKAPPVVRGPAPPLRFQRPEKE